jgi:hypothetical protein
MKSARPTSRGGLRFHRGSIDLSEPVDAAKSAPNLPGASYVYRASLIGAPHRFELTEGGLSWRIGGRSGLWPYPAIVSVRLSYRPVWMQSRRFRADIENASGERIRVLSTSWQTAALMAPQDNDYRAFMTALHGRLAEAGGGAALISGLRPLLYYTAVVWLVLLAVAMIGLLVRSVATGEFAGMLFLVGFAALFAWQIGGFIRRNRPRRYRFGELPGDVLP